MTCGGSPTGTSDSSILTLDAARRASPRALAAIEALDLHCLFALGDVDGPLSHEMQIGVAAIGEPVRSRLKTVQHHRSRDIAIKCHAIISGRLLANRLKADVERHLTDAGRWIRGSWWAQPADGLPALVQMVAAQARITLLSAADVQRLVHDAEQRSIGQVLR